MQVTANATYPRLASNVRRRRPLVSLTPLIDVVFILLLFFMLASSFLNWRSIPLDAPVREGAGGAIQGSLLVEVRREGLRLGGVTLSLSELSDRVREQLQDHPQRRVLVKPGPGISLQQTVTVLDGLAAAGANNMSLIRGAHGP